MIKNLYYKIMYYYYYINRFLDWFTWRFNNKYNIEMPSGNCPLQIEGQLSTGEYYYFRARGSSWRIEIYKREADFWEGKKLQLFTYSEKYGDEQFAAGWMSKREAIKFATLAIDKYYNPELFNVRDGI